MTERETVSGTSVSPSAPGEGTGRERLLLWTLAAIQFTHILDFMIVMPLGPQFMERFGIGPARFGLMVSIYTWSAGVSGLVAASFIDRFDRKKALLFLYAGFGIGTLACALARDFEVLLAARLVAGAFGGVTGATVLAIVADAVPPQRRGAAMGTVFSAGSIAGIAGVPSGLWLANRFGWHAPFWLIAGCAVLISAVAWSILPNLTGHLHSGPRRRPLAEMASILSVKDHWRAFALTIAMSLAGFMLIPYLSPSLVANAGVTNAQLPLVYLLGGAATFFTVRWAGRLGDRLGLLRVYTWSSVLVMFPILTVSLMPAWPLPAILAVTTAFMVISTSRFAPGMALITQAVEPRFRGGFMSVNSAVQQLTSGAAAMLAGAIVFQGPDGRLERYPVVGALCCLFVVLSILLARLLKKPQV